MATGDPIMDVFLREQLRDLRALRSKAPRMEVMPGRGDAPRQYHLLFHAKGLVQGDGDRIEEAAGARFSIRLPDDYLREDIDLEHIPVLRYFGPHPRPWHPNIQLASPHIVCVHLVPGTPLTTLVRAAYEIWTWQLVRTWDNGLNAEASRYARTHLSRFPIDPRPLTEAGRPRLCTRPLRKETPPQANEEQP